MTICVVDGQGGKIGSIIISRLKERLKENIEIIALGTNSAATQNMMKARANRGASGENAIVVDRQEGGYYYRDHEHTHGQLHARGVDAPDGRQR